MTADPKANSATPKPDRTEDAKLEAAFNKTVVHLRSHKIPPIPSNYEMIFQHYGREAGVEREGSEARQRTFYRRSASDFADGASRLSNAALEYERGASTLVTELKRPEAERNDDQIAELERKVAELSGDLASAVSEIDHLQEAVREFEEQASRDPLTGTLNRYGLDCAVAEIREASPKTSFVCMIGDLDRFKHINDTYGHPVGDKVLVHVSSLIMKHVPGQLVARFGGEEFIALMPNAELDAGVAVAEAIRAELAAQEFASRDDRFDVTISMGVVDGAPGTPLDDLYIEADARLYQAKIEGRNRVVSADRAA